MAIRIIEVVEPDHLAQAYEVRRKVFINEQHIPEREEFDGMDNEAIHFLGMVDGVPAGTCRVVQGEGECSIQRLAVLKEFRGNGIGSELMFAAVKWGQDHGFDMFTVNAQLRKVPFYEKFGFARTGGDIFLDCGIPHRTLVLTLRP